jgi:hypothetical protein
MQQQAAIKRLERRIAQQDRTIENYRWAMEHFAKPPRYGYRRRYRRMADPFNILEWGINLALKAIEWTVTNSFNLAIVLLEWLVAHMLRLLETWVRRWLTAIQRQPHLAGPLNALANFAIQMNYRPLKGRQKPL